MEPRQAMAGMVAMPAMPVPAVGEAGESGEAGEASERIAHDVPVDKPLFVASGDTPVPPSYSVPPLVQAGPFPQDAESKAAGEGGWLPFGALGWSAVKGLRWPSRRVGIMAALLFGPALLTTVAFFAVAQWQAHRDDRAATPRLGSQEQRPVGSLEREEGKGQEKGQDDAGLSEPPSEVGPPAPIWRVSSLQSDSKVVLSNGVVGKRPFLVALAAAGISRDDQSRLTKAFAGVRKFDRCHPTDAFTVAREAKTGKLLAFEFATSPADVYQARRDEAGTLQAKRLELRVERLAVAVALTVGEDLRESVVKAGLDDDMLKMLDDALHGHVELSSLRRGARLRVLASEDRIEGEFGRYAELEAVEYNAPGPGAAALRVYHFGPATPPNASAPVKLGGYYDAQGRQPYHGGWRSPVPMARLSSRFNPRRKHPVLHIIMPHNGVDFAAPSGTPVYATGPGVIRSVGDGGPCGNMVQIQHSNGLVSAYCHLSRFGGVQLGQHVEGRQLIGYVGQTGRATGPHLHFAIKRGEAFMDPLALKLDGVRVVPPADRGEFARRREEFDARLDTIALSAPLADVDGGADTSDAEVINELPPEGPGTNP